MSEEEFLLKWNNHQSNFVDVFSDLLRDEAFVDVTLVCGGEAVPGHKMVLSACSPLLQRILRENPCKHPVIILNDVSAPDMRSMMRFIYQGEVSVSQNELAGFLKTADNLQIKGLAEDKPANLVYLDKDKDNPEKKRKDKDQEFHRNDTSINNNNNTSSKPSKRQRLSTNNNTIPNNISPEECNNISPAHITNNAGYSPSAPRASAATTPHHISPGVVHHGRSSHQRSNADSHSSSHRRSRDNNKLNIGKSDMVEDLSCKVLRDSSAHLSNIPLNKSSLLSSLQPQLNSLQTHINTNSITIEPAVTTTLPVKDENVLVKTEPLDLVGEMVWSEGRGSINNKLDEERGESGDGEVPMIPLTALGGALEGVAAAFCASPVGLHSLDGGDEVKYEEESRGDASTGSDDANTNATTASLHDDAGCASNSIFDAVKNSMDLSKTNSSSSDVAFDEQRVNENTSPFPPEQVSLPLVLPPVSAMAAVPGAVAVAATQPTMTTPALSLPHPLQLLHHQQLQLRHNQFLLQEQQQQRTQQKQLIESNPGSSVTAASIDSSHNNLVVTASNNNNNNLHKCRLCPFTTSNPYTFTRHLRIHTGNKEFRCRVCHFASSRKDSLIRHFRMKHLMGEMALYQEMDSKDIEELALLKDDESRPWYKTD